MKTIRQLLQERNAEIAKRAKTEQYKVIAEVMGLSTSRIKSIVAEQRRKQC